MQRYTQGSVGMRQAKDGEWVDYRDAKAFQKLAKRLAEYPTKTQLEILVRDAQKLLGI